MNKLTEADYTTRKADLADVHRIAADAFKLASHKQATGNGAAEDVAAAKAHLDGVAGQQEALEAAWMVQLESNTEAAIGQRNEQWAVSDAAVGKGLAERQLAADAIEKALHVVGEAYARYGKANDDIINAVRPWAGSDFEKLAQFRATVSAHNNSSASLIAGVLASYGIKFNGTNASAARAHVEGGSFSERVRGYNAQVAGRAASFAPVEA